MKYYTSFNTTLCEIIIAGDEAGVSNLFLNTGNITQPFQIDSSWKYDDVFFKDTARQIRDYFNGELKQFSIALNPQGTTFQKKVWHALTRIPYGAVCSYKDIARLTGNEKAARAVGMANSKNPVPVVIPCHRVIGSNGSLTGFAHGVDIKKYLIELEQPNHRKAN